MSEGNLISRREWLLGSALTAAGLAVAPSLFAEMGRAPISPSDSIVWTFDRLDNIGGVETHVEGHPKLIDSPLGKAVQFDGVGDALFIEQHPLAGAATFTFEALFRPDGGAFEQRWFHLAQTESASPPATDARVMFEIRVVKESWYLDAFVKGPGYNHTLAFPDKLYPIGRWFHVAQVYDGKNYRSYVDGALQGEAAIEFKPQGPGRASVGTRINRVNYFKGAVRQARFTKQALMPDAFLKAS